MRNRSVPSNMSACSILAAIGWICMLTGCMMQRAHYKSLSEFREESSINYSQQVLDTIVGVRDYAKLPIFFRVEGGNSSWSPSYTAGPATATIPITMLEQIGVSAGIAGGESFSSQLQYNDFGSAAMSRVNALYSLVCFPIRYEDLNLPHGLLYTIIDEADSKDRFLLWAKTRHGRYLGVTPEKNEKFFKFAHDVTYWTQHVPPDLKGLLSTPGILYRFAVEFGPAEAKLINAVLSKYGAQEAVVAAQKAYETKQQAFTALKEDAKTSKISPAILQTLLTFEREELQARAQAVASVSAHLGKLEEDIAVNRMEVERLLSALEGVLLDLKTYDPDASGLNVDVITEGLQERLQVILRGDRKEIKKLSRLVLPSVTGEQASESVDELYRERFEALPQRFDAPLQRTQ